MPFPVAAAISAGSSIVSGVINSIFQGSENRKNRRFQEEMLRRQQAYNDTVIDRQMAYQDKVNAENFAWNDESNRRARLERAGYNPFLFDGNTAGSAGGVSLSSGSSSLPPNQVNPMEGFASSVGRAVSDFMQTKMINEQIKQQQLQNSMSQIQLDSQNFRLPDGRPAWQLDVSRKVADTQMANSQANIAAYDEWRVQSLQAFQQMEALDENGQPIVDEDGKPVSNFDAEQQSKLNDMFTKVANQMKDLTVKGYQIKNLDADYLLKQANIELTEEQKKVFRAQVNELNSRINTNNAQARAALAAAFETTQRGLTTQAMLPYTLGSALADTVSKENAAKQSSYNLRDYEFDYKKSDWIRGYENSFLGKGAALGGRVLGDFSPALGTALKFFLK